MYTILKRVLIRSINKSMLQPTDHLVLWRHLFTPETPHTNMFFRQDVEDKMSSSYVCKTTKKMNLHRVYLKKRQIGEEEVLEGTPASKTSRGSEETADSEQVDTHTEVVEQSNEIVEQSTEIVEQSTEVVEQSTEVVEQSNEIVEQSTEIVEQSTEIVEQSTEVVEQSTEIVEQSNEIVEQSTEIVEQSTEVVEQSTEIVEQSTEVVEQSTQVRIDILCQLSFMVSSQCPPQEDNMGQSVVEKTDNLLVPSSDIHPSSCVDLTERVEEVSNQAEQREDYEETSGGDSRENTGVHLEGVECSDNNSGRLMDHPSHLVDTTVSGSPYRSRPDVADGREASS